MRSKKKENWSSVVVPRMFALKLKLMMTKKQATKNKAKRHQKASNLTKSLMDGEASEVLIIGPNGFLYHRRPDGTITKRNGVKHHT
jgi:hypothetical protein